MATRGVPLFEERDYNHATDDTYKRLRAEASAFHDKKTALSKQSQSAYKQGNKAEAHELSVKSKQMMQKAIDADRKAAEYVFKENNADSAQDEIDLHGLYVLEAEWILQRRIAECARTNQLHLRVIVGKGLHSQNGIAKLKPAVDELCDKSGLRHHMDPKNSGVLVIDFTNSPDASVPDEWTQPGYPQQTYQQPQYQQNYQQPYQQQPQQFDTGNGLVNALLKMFCACINK